MSWLSPDYLIHLVLSTLGYATPLTIAALGGLFCERAGVVNIALEGLMLIGAFFAIFGADIGGSWVFGVLLAVIMGTAFSMLHAVAAIKYRADQIVSGTALLFICQGCANFLNLQIFGPQGNPPGISRIPAPGGVSLLIPAMIALVFGVRYVIFHTPFGLHLRAVGEHPRAADTVGINVFKMRYIAVGISGAFAGLAGAYVSFNVGNYSQNMTNGAGFIALAALIFGKWNPFGAFSAACLFGFCSALSDRLQGTGMPPEILSMLPYIVTVIALAGFVGRALPPAASGKPYVKA